MNELEVIANALEKANMKGAFTLQESSLVLTNFNALQTKIEVLQKKVAAQAAKDAKPPMVEQESDGKSES